MEGLNVLLVASLIDSSPLIFTMTFTSIQSRWGREGRKEKEGGKEREGVRVMGNRIFSTLIVPVTPTCLPE